MKDKEGSGGKAVTVTVAVASGFRGNAPPVAVQVTLYVNVPAVGKVPVQLLPVVVPVGPAGVLVGEITHEPALVGVQVSVALPPGAGTVTEGFVKITDATGAVTFIVRVVLAFVGNTPAGLLHSTLKT